MSVSNPSKVARTDAPVVVDLSKLGAIGNIQRAVVTLSLIHISFFSLAEGCDSGYRSKESWLIQLVSA